MTKKIITSREHVILLLLLIFRFINSKQLQEYLKHKDHRRINSWLKDLMEKGYIERIFQPIFGQLTKPAVYFLTAKGRTYFKRSYRYHFPQYLKRISRDYKVSKAFRIRCQIIADWYITLFYNCEKTNEKNDNHLKRQINIDIVNNLITQLTTDSDKEEKVPLNILQFFTPAYYPLFPLLEKVKPDSYLRKRTTQGIDHGLLFVLDAYIPRFLLRYTLKRIFDSLDEENWENDTVHSLQIFYLCPNNQIIIYLRRLLPSYLEKYYGGKPLSFHLGTRNQMYNWKNGKTEKMKWIILSSSDY